eukprot:TRINITY_DN2486_c1_g4_i1.p1 TRINITY_DN2486_c1_g4~~TRINITY_DN2486_c1_g4_i1.p1  ORF type:complete len:125 (+),score=15.40 TRINITY_DN2486_c1_g4_i1:29-403(+)
MKSVVQVLVCLLTVTALARAEDASEDEKIWEEKSLAVLNHLAEDHIAHMERQEHEKERTDDEAVLARLRHNLAVHVSRLVIVHPLGDGKKRIRKAFEKSKLRQVFFWDDLFPPENDLLPEDEDL